MISRRKPAVIKIALNGVAAICFTIAAACFTTQPHAAENPVNLTDNFDTAPLDTQRWSLKRAPAKRYWIDRHTVFRGNGSLAIRVKGSDISEDCNCQQTEVREANTRRLNFGDEAWYAFTMRIRGNWPKTGGQRWVIGGWKQESNGSAFVAQRFDRGVFHITIESGNTRVLLATAARETGGFLDALAKGIGGGFEFVGERKTYEGSSDLQIEYGDAQVLPDPAADWVSMLYRIRGGLNGDGIVEVYANGKFVARATGTVGVPDMAGPTQYFKIGHNRHLMPGTATLFIDDFRRAPSREAIESVN